MRVTSRADYGVRAAVYLAGHPDVPVKGEVIAGAVDAPRKFLESILGELRVAGIVRSQRGSSGGYRLARPAHEIAVADILRATEGPMAQVRGEAAEDLEYPEPVTALQEVWVAVRAAVRDVLEGVTVEDVARGTLPDRVRELARDPRSWESTAERQARARRPSG
jgi:Rrf2 family protein